MLKRTWVAKPAAMRLGCKLVLLMLSTAVGFADSVRIFGPQTYTKKSGTVYSITVFAAPDPWPEHILEIYNGGLEGELAPSNSVIITLNGRKLRQRLVSKNGHFRRSKVPLLPINDLIVELGGNEGAAVTVQILSGVDTDAAEAGSGRPLSQLQEN